MSSLTYSFFVRGLAVPGVQELQYSRYPYSVRPNLLEKSPTLKDAEDLLTSLQKDSLQNRVQPVPGSSNVTIVDKFFRIQAQQQAPREAALQLWSELRWRCKKIGIESGITAAGLTLLALQGPPVYILVALFVGIVAACCYAGWSLQRYHSAEKQWAVWNNSGEDFAQRRSASLELSLDKISKQKCHYHLEQPGGTLLGVEILFIFMRNLKHFAEPLLARKCDLPQEQDQWVADFLTTNPLMINFFQDNPLLLKEKEWEDVQKFQYQILQLQNLLKNLKDLYVPHVSKNEQTAKQVQENLKKTFKARADAVSTEQALDLRTAELYQQRLLQALTEEYFSKVSKVMGEHRVKASYFRSLVYSQVRVLLEQATKNFLEGKSDTLDFAAFTNPKIIPNFQQDLAEITQLYPQNVIAKAKSLAPDGAYQKFVDEVFKP